MNLFILPCGATFDTDKADEAVKVYRHRRSCKICQQKDSERAMKLMKGIYDDETPTVQQLPPSDRTS